MPRRLRGLRRPSRPSSHTHECRLLAREPLAHAPSRRGDGRIA
jgi:hypothetical protein